MTDKEIKDKARELLSPACRVCPECNGIACRGEVPGMGGKGTGRSFIDSFNKLKSISLNMKTIHDAKKVDSTAEFFGETMSIPVFAAPVTGTTFNMGGKLTEREYITRVIEGCHAAGILPMVGDSADPTFLIDNLNVLKENNKKGIAFIKPWDNDVVADKAKTAIDSNSIAVGVDVDAAGLVTLNMHGKGVTPKTFDELKELIKSIDAPFIVKGVLTVEDAKLAYEAGAKAIVVSNHGGRVLDCARATCEVLPEIAKELKGKITIFADGGVRDGIDVFKMLALGADGVLIGRPFVTYSFGGGKEGVEMYINKLKSELQGAMILCGAKTIKDINPSMITYNFK